MSDFEKENSIQKAKTDLNSIVDFAKRNLVKEAEERIQSIVESKLDELLSKVNVEEETELNEAIKVETDDIKIDVKDNGTVSIVKKEEGAAAATGDGEQEAAPKKAPVDPVVNKSVEEPAFDVASDEEEIELEDDNEIALVQEEVVKESNTDQVMQQQPQGMENAEVPAPQKQDAIAMLAQAIEMLIDEKIGEAGAGEEGAGDVDIIDDEAAMAAGAPEMAQPAPAAQAPQTTPQAAPANPNQQVAEEVDEILEIIDEDETGDEMFDIEVDDEETVDEMKMMGVSNSVQRTVGKSAGPQNAVANRGRGEEMNENKALYEAKVAELNKENVSLKNKIKDFQNAFIELREEFHKMRVFNKKLSLAYNLLENGGFTASEKEKIAQEFDQANSIEEAEKIYKEVISEKKINNANRKPSSTISSAGINVVQPKESLYESAEMKRLKRLAGIDKNDPESLIG